MVLLRLVCPFIVLLITLNSCNQAESTRVEKGTIDLRSYDFSSAQPVTLKGDWLFSWNSFAATSEEFAADKLIAVPGTWSSYTGAALFRPNTGYGTYGLKILLPEGQSTWSLIIPPINSAYRLSVDGRILASSGKLSTGPEMRPAADAQVVQFNHNKKELFVLIQVSNYHFNSGGIWGPLLIGTPRMVQDYQSRSNLSSAFLIGSLFIIGIYHLFIFALRRKDKSPLYFAIICFFIGIRESFGGPAFYFLLFPYVPYEISLKILYCSFPVCMIFFVQYFAEINPGFSSALKRTVLAVCSIYLLLILLSPNTVYGGLLPLLSILFIGIVIYLIQLTIKSYKTDKATSLLILTGICTLIAFFINDVMFESGIIQTAFLLPLGFFIFTLCQSILLAIRFSRAFQQSEELSVELVRSEELMVIEEFKNKFFSNITHEFRTPLMLIISPVEQLIRSRTEDTALSRSLQTVHRNALSLLSLINQLLDIAKLEAGSLKLSLSSGNVPDFFNYIADNFRTLAEEKKLTLNYNCSADQQEILFDWGQLEKISYNLIMNAIKFTPPGGTIHLSVTKDADQLQLIVSDTGQGIAHDQQEHIFDRFVQLDGNQNMHAGTGIGLSLVRELTHLMEGNIQVQSQPGKGSTFTLFFPLPEQQGADVPHWSGPAVPLLSPSFQPADYQAAYDPERDTILLVEDNEELTDFIRSILVDKFNVITAPDGLTGWELCCSEMPGLVLSDVMMPRMDGMSLCRHIKESEKTDHIGVILLTAKSNQDSKEEGLSSRANDYLTKPFHATELLLRIDNFFSYQKTLREHYRAELEDAKGIAPPRTVNPFLTKLYSCIERNLDNSDLSVEQLADELAVSSRTLHRKLSALLGYSPNEIIRRYRLHKAAELLQAGYNVSETAYRVGFETASYFGQCFKEQFKVTPTEFQNPA